MADLLIRHVDEETKRRLAVRAAENGRSMQAELLHIITNAARFDESRRVPEDFSSSDIRIRSMNPILEDDSDSSAFGILSHKADPSRIPLEEGAWARAAVEKELARMRERQEEGA